VPISRSEVTQSPSSSPLNMNSRKLSSSSSTTATTTTIVVNNNFNTINSNIESKEIIGDVIATTNKKSLPRNDITLENQTNNKNININNNNKIGNSNIKIINEDLELAKNKKNGFLKKENLNSSKPTITLNNNSVNVKNDILNTKPPLTKPTKSPIPTIMSNNQPGVLLEKKSLDKFLKLATYNSASLLDLNQQQQQQQQQTQQPIISNKPNIPSSKSSIQLASNNLTSLCGREEEQRFNSSSSSSSISKPKPLPPPMPRQPPQTNVKSPPNKAPSSANRQKQEFLIQNFISNNNKKLDVDASALLNGFRIPSSRHFCGRLLSANMSSAGSVATSEQSESQSSSSASSTSSAVLITVPTVTGNVVVQQQKSKYFSSEEDEYEEEEDEDQDYYDNEYNCVVIKPRQHSKAKNVKLKQQVINVSTSSPSTSSSSPKSPDMVAPQTFTDKRNEGHHHIHHHHYHHHHLHHQEPETIPVVSSKPVPAQRRSVSSSNTNQQRMKVSDEQQMVVSPRVRFNDSNPQAKSQVNISNRTNEIKYTANSSSKSSEDILAEKQQQQQLQQMKKSQTTYESFSKNSQQTKQQTTDQNMAKSADNLIETQKKKELTKQIDLHTSQHMNQNSSEMTLSKSIKDLRLYVSNSFSPSLIVRPPSNQQTKQKIELHADENFYNKIKQHQQSQPIYSVRVFLFFKSRFTKTIEWNHFFICLIKFIN